jgi:glycosyltransferase involved in cell wall biosynthesis
MACGTPVVGFEAKGIQSIVQDMVNGRLARPHISKELAMRLQSMLKNTDEQKAMSKAALQTAKDYDWNTISREVVSVYADLSN